MRRNKKRFIPTGIYSEGTLQSIDMLDVNVGILSMVRLARKQRAKVTRYASLVRSYDEYKDGPYDEKYAGPAQELAEIIDRYCAPYTYFGSSEGDGACIGVWADVASVMDDMRDDEILNVDDVPGSYNGYAAEVNDHGNVTLYEYTNGRRREIWGVV